MRNVVLLAPNGQVGFELSRVLIPAFSMITLSRKDVDFSNFDELLQILTNIKADIIINAAAYTAVDKAEVDVKSAFLINEKLPLFLSDIANAKNALLVHYSSDYVYDGSGIEPWKEIDCMKSHSVYGKSKLAGDLAIIENCKKYLIFRTSWVYAARGHNFMKTMLKLAQERDSLNVVNDQFGSPTSARLIAQTTAFILYQLSRQDNIEKYNGVYHLAPSGVTTWHGFASEIFKLAREKDVALTLSPNNFWGISTEEYPTPAKRPKNSRLDISKIESVFGFEMPTWQVVLNQTFLEWLEYQQ